MCGSFPLNAYIVKHKKNSKLTSKQNKMIIFLHRRSPAAVENILDEFYVNI